MPPAIMPMLLSPSPSETDSEGEGEDSTLLLAAGTHSRLRRRPAVAVHARLLPDSRAPGTVLWCGAPQTQTPDPAVDGWWDARRPAAVPFLPLPLDDDDDAAPQSTSARASSGCGGRVHGGAHAARGGGRWVGYVGGVERTVVPLAAEYFARGDGAALGLGLGEAGCGCSVRGVGCAVCGNVLGALHTPCRTHQSRKGQVHYVFLPNAVSPPIEDAESSHAAYSAPPPLPPAESRAQHTQ
ncbi:hypothetical protein C8R47DRAFT_720438 [Mycena vitilis]|nr:hypothetical protein C8R47DRAFT_720438 [Mycena vitilis]